METKPTFDFSVFLFLSFSFCLSLSVFLFLYFSLFFFLYFYISVSLSLCQSLSFSHQYTFLFLFIPRLLIIRTLPLKKTLSNNLKIPVTRHWWDLSFEKSISIHFYVFFFITFYSNQLCNQKEFHFSFFMLYCSFFIVVHWNNIIEIKGRRM